VQGARLSHLPDLLLGSDIDFSMYIISDDILLLAFRIAGMLFDSS
jgi:hypothetical protein